MTGMMPPQQSAEEVKRDVQATLAARRELGPEYDDHFLSQLAERLTAQVHREVANAPRIPAPSNKLSRDQRTAVAICSLIFAIPLVAISISGGPFYFIATLVMIALINVLASR